MHDDRGWDNYYRGSLITHSALTTSYVCCKLEDSQDEDDFLWLFTEAEKETESTKDIGK